MTRPLLKAKSLTRGITVWSADPKVSAADKLSCLICGKPVVLKSKKSVAGRLAWFAHVQANEACEVAKAAQNLPKLRSLYEAPAFNLYSAMSHFFNQPIFESPVEKRSFSLKQATLVTLQNYVAYVNTLNKMRVELESVQQPGKVPLKAANLDESAVVERILEGVFGQDVDFQAFMQSGEVQLTAPTRRRRQKPA